MITLQYEALRAAHVSTDPFAHVVVPDFVPPDELRAVLADMPQIGQGGSIPPSALRLGPRARALIAALEGQTFREAVAGLFALDLKAAPVMITVRGRTREKDGRIHCDSTAKRVTVLLYLNTETEAWRRQQGCLRLLRGPADIEDYAVEVPPVNGTLLVFPNGPTTWHGHKTFVGQRYAIQLNYMTNDDAARSELRRHRVSAFVKRLTPAL
jgi:hypothetical protein